MSVSDTFETCKSLGLTLEQYHLAYLVFLRRSGYGALSQKYLHMMVISPEDVSVLIDKEFAISHRDPATVNSLILTEKGESLFKPGSMGEEFWDKYPSVFPLSTGGFFVTKGASKEGVLDVYHKKIDGNLARHQHVMKQLERYIKMVDNGHINGNRIIDFVGGELWEEIAKIPDNMISNFKDDI